MIDTVTILFSTLMVLFVVIRAIKLDRDLPWFPRPSSTGALKPDEPKAGAARRVVRSR